jgi:hypothetical protein
MMIFLPGYLGIPLSFPSAQCSMTVFFHQTSGFVEVRDSILRPSQQIDKISLLYKNHCNCPPRDCDRGKPFITMTPKVFLLDEWMNERTFHGTIKKIVDLFNVSQVINV